MQRAGLPVGTQGLEGGLSRVRSLGEGASRSSWVWEELGFPSFLSFGSLGRAQGPGGQGPNRSRADSRLSRSPRPSTVALARSPPSAALMLHRKLWQQWVPTDATPRLTLGMGQIGEQPLFRV